MKVDPYPFAPALKSSHNQVNIVLLIDIIHTLVNVIIANPTWIDLVSWAVFFHEVTTIIATQAKNGLYHNQFPMDMFIFLVVEVFRCLHQ
jgi:hypothetical protein